MLQLTTLLLMLIDHIGVIYELEIFRIIGRLAMPFYAYFIYRGFQASKSKSKYIFRVTLIAVISEPGYLFFTGFDVFKLNVCFTWVLCLVGLVALEYKKLFGIIIYISFIVITIILPFEYICLPLIWVIFWKHYGYKFIYDFSPEEKKVVTKECLLYFPLIFFSCIYKYQVVSVFFCPFIISVFKHFKIQEYFPKKYKWVWRCFYPAQFYILNGVKGFLL